VLSVSAGAANAALVVVGAPSAAPVTLDHVTDLYLGKASSLPVIDLPDSSPARAEFDRKVLGKDVGQVKALWARLAFTGRGTPPKEVGDAAAVKKAIAANPAAIGYLDESAVDASVKVLLALPK
jgi:ABC-type phosphate transport system substrate-binding protein